MANELNQAFIPLDDLEDPALFEEFRLDARRADDRANLLTFLAQQTQLGGNGGPSILAVATEQATSPEMGSRGARDSKLAGYVLKLSGDGTVQDILLHTPVGPQSARTVRSLQQMGKQLPSGRPGNWGGIAPGVVAYAAANTSSRGSGVSRAA